MTGPFPILTALRAGKTFYDQYGDEAEKLVLARSERRKLDEITKVSAEGLENVSWRQVTDALHRGGDMAPVVGPQRLPFPEMWIECPFPSEGKPYLRNREVQNIAVAVEESFFSSPGGDTEQTLCNAYTVFVQWVDGAIMRARATLLTALNENYVITGFTIGTAPGLEERLFNKIRNGPDADYLMWVCLPSIYAIGLMNCKNVQLRTERHRSRSSNPTVRRQQPAFTYRTIVLPNRSTGGNSGYRGVQAAAGLHKVRGHFKTFTAERPLMGKHVGTYWWGWQTRGTPESGQIHSDYQVSI